MTETGHILTLEAGPMAHGGHCVARHEGRVVFLRHAIPGETVRAVLTEAGDRAKFWRADAIDVLDASDHRRAHPWGAADALGAYDRDGRPVGGADYGHITLAHQRRLKAHVFRDALLRIGRFSPDALPVTSADAELHAEDIGGADPQGMHWRTRVGFAVTEGGRLAMKPHRSHELVAVETMPLAVDAIARSAIFGWDFGGATGADVLAPGGQGPLTLVVHADQSPDLGALRSRLTSAAVADPQIGSVILAAREPAASAPARHRRRGRYDQLRPSPVDYQVVSGDRTVQEPLPVRVSLPDGTHRDSVELHPEGFWQVHCRAPQSLVRAVDEISGIEPGAAVVDLYAGAGLFTALAAARSGKQGQVLSVEAAEASSASAAQLFDGVPGVEVVRAPVEKIIDRLNRADVVILDPPRAGANQRVLTGIDASGPDRIVYVSCDPASFARDAKQLAGLGWSMEQLRILDMYPNTHHMESVALFRRGESHS